MFRGFQQCTRRGVNSFVLALLHRSQNIQIVAFIVAATFAIPASTFAAGKPRMAVHLVSGDPPLIQANGHRTRGWTLHVTVGFRYDDMETDDQLIGVSKAGPVSCGRDMTVPFINDLKDKSQDGKIHVFKCRIEKVQKRTGRMKIVFHYKSADAEKTFKNVGSMSFVIKRGKNAYYAVQDNIVGPVFYSYDYRHMRHYYHKKHPRLWFTTWIKLRYFNSTPKNIMARCKLDGEKAFKSKLRAGTSTGASGEYTIYKIAVFAKHHLPKDGSIVKHPSNWAFGDNPGDYQCRITIGGQVYRRWKFRVGKDGMIVASGCGRALGMDIAHGVFTKNKATKDYKFSQQTPKKALYWMKTPRVCEGLL